jgi:hypothetical protein
MEFCSDDAKIKLLLRRNTLHLRKKGQSVRVLLISFFLFSASYGICEHACWIPWRNLSPINTYHAVPMLFPCRFKARFTHTMPFPCRDPATTFVSHWPPPSEIGMFLVTIFLELPVVAARSRTLAGVQNATCRL